jgi:hypothetical protein
MMMMVVCAFVSCHRNSVRYRRNLPRSTETRPEYKIHVDEGSEFH